MIFSPYSKQVFFAFDCALYNISKVSFLCRNKTNLMLLNNYITTFKNVIFVSTNHFPHFSKMASRLKFVRSLLEFVRCPAFRFPKVGKYGEATVCYSKLEINLSMLRLNHSLILRKSFGAINCNYNYRQSIIRLIIPSFLTPSSPP